MKFKFVWKLKLKWFELFPVINKYIPDPPLIPPPPYKLKRDRQHNCKKKKKRKTKRQKMTCKTKHEKNKDVVTQIPLKARVNSGAPEGIVVLAPLVAPVVCIILYKP